MRRLLGARLHQYLYDQKMAFARWRTKTKREVKLLVRGLPRRAVLGLLHPINRLLPGFKVLPLPAFLIGPTNSANQGSEWAQSLTRAGAKSQSLRISSDPAAEWFSTDISISREEWLKFPTRLALATQVAASKDVLLFESLRPIFRLENIRNGQHQILEDIALMKRIGKSVGVIFHGSDIRDVDLHAARFTFSPFHSNNPEIEKLRKRSNENRAILPELAKAKVPIFVSTLDLLQEVATAAWLPIVIDFEKFNQVARISPIYATPKLRVLFLPSRSWLKSADLIIPVLEKLDAEGVIEYVRTESVPHDQIPRLFAQADLVVDQLLGGVGVMAIEALAAGRLVMSHIPENLSRGPVGNYPIISITPESFEDELQKVAGERPLPEGGVEFARRWHDGRESARVIGAAFGWKLRS
jgi:hypothetical protein